MSVATYQYNGPIAALFEDSAEPLVGELPSGALVLVPEGNPDFKGMIGGTYDGKSVRVFQRDLVEHADRLASVRVR